jgi:beta-1,4-mannosyl-glycoprotein beta-1,4-N-acetylglucosaminyltransferase
MPVAHETSVWDCFLFNDELTLLEFRLRLLNPVVDRFVVVESTRSHTGQPKNAHLAENIARFDRYRQKIEHIVVDDMPEDAPPWTLERNQRAAVWRGLAGVGQEDLVMVGDLDEVPDPAVVRELARTLQRPTRLAMRHFIFAANFELADEWTDGTMAARGNQLGDSRMAVLMGDPDAAWSAENDHITPRAGCHLSYLGGQAAVAAKLTFTPHQEFAVPALTRPRHINRCVALGVQVAGIYAIKRRRHEELPTTLQLLAEMHPDLFDFRPGPPRLVVLLYKAFARVRTRLPLRLLDLIDAHPAPFGVVFGPFLLIADGVRQIAAKYRLRHRARCVLGVARRVARADQRKLGAPKAPTEG